VQYQAAAKVAAELHLNLHTTCQPALDHLYAGKKATFFVRGLIGTLKTLLIPPCQAQDGGIDGWRGGVGLPLRRQRVRAPRRAKKAHPGEALQMYLFLECSQKPYVCV